MCRGFSLPSWVIVRACNNHAALVDLLTEMRDIYARGGDFYIDFDEAEKRLGRINAALKSAKP